MCCFNDLKKLRGITSQLQPKDWLIGYKLLQVEQFQHGCRIVTPYRKVPVDLSTQLFSAKSPKYPPILRRANRQGQEVNYGIHVFMHRDSPEEHRKFYSLSDYVIAKVYGQVKDLLAVGSKDAVFRKIVIDYKSLAHLKGRVTLEERKVNARIANRYNNWR